MDVFSGGFTSLTLSGAAALVERCRFTRIKWSRLLPFTIWLQIRVAKRVTPHRGHACLGLSSSSFLHCILSGRLPPELTCTQTNAIQIIYCGFNLLMWTNQGLRLAFCSVQFSLNERTKKKVILAWVNSKSCPAVKFGQNSDVVSKDTHIDGGEQIISLFSSMNSCALLATSLIMYAWKCLHQQRYTIMFSFSSMNFKRLNLQAFFNS